MNLVTVLNSYNLGDKINISPINILTKLKSNYNFNENKNNLYENNNMNQLSNPFIIIDRENDKKILRQYYENLNNENKDIIEQTAFGVFNGNNNNQIEENIIVSQPNQNILNNNKNNHNLNYSCLENKENNENYMDNDRMNSNAYNQSQYNSKKDCKIIQFNNMMMRSNKSSINYKNNKSPYKNDYNNYNEE